MKKFLDTLANFFYRICFIMGILTYSMIFILAVVCALAIPIGIIIAIYLGIIWLTQNIKF